VYCISVFGRNTGAVLSAMRKASEIADVIELRLDLMEGIELEKLLTAAAKPVLVACRTTREGGKSDEDWDVILHRQKRAMELGADFLDLEWSMPEDLRKKFIGENRKSRVVLSRHFPKLTPGRKELSTLLGEMAASGADIVKIVTNALNLEDNFRVLALIPEARKLNVPVVAFAMGPAGRISRLLCVPMGGFFTFACMDENHTAAAGQMTVQRMRRLTEELLHGN
jgi:3-dehydroquinate dehydratase type I